MPNSSPTVVTAGVLKKGGRYLVAKRPADDDLAGKWEFPGGKVEDRETPESCLVRELAEELGADFSVTAFLGESVHDYKTRHIRLLAFTVAHHSRVITSRVHEELRWVTQSELDGIDLAPADIPFREMLRRRS